MNGSREAAAPPIEIGYRLDRRLRRIRSGIVARLTARILEAVALP